MMLITAALRRLAIAALLALFGTVAHGQEARPALPPPVLPGIGAHDPRVRADPNAAPWRAIGKLQANTGNLHQSCTGSLVAPTIVLTAAHCVFNPRTGRNFPPASLHFLVGYESGRYADHAVGRALVTGPGFDARQPQRTLGSDWALLTLDRPLGTQDRILPLDTTPIAIGAEVTTGGYSQDHPLLLTVDPDCRIVGVATDAAGGKLLRDDCTATHGASGAPLLVREGGIWRIAGMRVAARMGAASGLAAAIDEIRRLL